MYSMGRLHAKSSVLRGVTFFSATFSIKPSEVFLFLALQSSLHLLWSLLPLSLLSQQLRKVLPKKHEGSTGHSPTVWCVWEGARGMFDSDYLYVTQHICIACGWLTGFICCSTKLRVPPLKKVRKNSRERQENWLENQMEWIIFTHTHMGLFQTLLVEIYFQSRRLFLGMDVIGSFICRWIGKREVVTGSSERVNFPSWQLTLANCEFALRWSESFWSSRTKSLMHAINHPSTNDTNIQFWVNSSRHMHPLGTYFSLRRDK